MAFLPIMATEQASGSFNPSGQREDTTEAQAWVRPLLQSLRTGSEACVVQRLEQLLAPAPAPAQRAELEREIYYFQNHRDHLHYQAMAEAGASRGSRAAESLDQQRQRGCGQAWGRLGLTHLLRLCVLVKNRDDPHLWN